MNALIVGLSALIELATRLLFGMCSVSFLSTITREVETRISSFESTVITIMNSIGNLTLGVGCKTSWIAIE